MAIVAAALVVILFGALTIGTRLFGESHKQAQEIDDGLGDTVSTTTTAAPAQRSAVTTTTLYNGMTQQQIEQPESDLLNATQLAYQFNQQNSGLTPQSYTKATQVGKDFVIASATGVGEDKFADYYATTPNDPWVDDFQFIYASAVATFDPKLVKVIVWYTGKEHASGLPMTQVAEGVYLARTSSSSLDFKPKDWGGEAAPEDPDIGVKVVN